MKNKSVEQLIALKSIPFSPGEIWSEQHVMSMVKIHVPVIQKAWNLNCSHLSIILTDFKNNTWKWGRVIFAGRVGTIPALFLYEA